jgi:hypothetical protein
MNSFERLPLQSIYKFLLHHIDDIFDIFLSGTQANHRL